MESKTTLIRRAMGNGLAFEWDGELMFVPSTTNAQDVVKAIVNSIEYYGVTGGNITTYTCEHPEGSFKLHLPTFAKKYAKQICERFYHATNGAHPEDECQDRWQENLRIHMLDVCDSAEVDPCAIIMSIHNSKNN